MGCKYWDATNWFIGKGLKTATRDIEYGGKEEITIKIICNNYDEKEWMNIKGCIVTTHGRYYSPMWGIYLPKPNKDQEYC